MANSENPYQLLQRVAYDVERVKAWFESLDLDPDEVGRWEGILRDASLGLSKREVEVCARILADYSVREIAKGLVISENTVGTHIKSIYAKWGVTSRPEMRRFVKQRWSRGRESNQKDHKKRQDSSLFRVMGK